MVSESVVTAWLRRKPRRSVIKQAMRRGIGFLLLGLACGALACTAPRVALPNRASPSPAVRTPMAPLPTDTLVHLVIDLGSSGTRLCLYRVTRPSLVSGRKLAQDRPVCSRVQGGLAKQTRGHRPERIAGLVDAPLRLAWQLLGDAQVGRRSHSAQSGADRGRAGYRRVSGSRHRPATEPSRVAAALSRGRAILKQEAGLANVVAWPITGQEEGRLAWLGLTQSANPPQEFAAVEAGGATVQLAIGSRGARRPRSMLRAIRWARMSSLSDLPKVAVRSVAPLKSAFTQSILESKTAHNASLCCNARYSSAARFIG